MNNKQDRFAQEYVVDYNMTQAAVRAGYSDKTAASQGSRLLKNAEVLTRVRELQAEQTARLCVTADWVIHKLVDVTQKALQETAVEEWDHAEQCMKPTGEYVFDSKGATKALELLGKHLSMFTDKVSLVGNIPVQIVDDLDG